MIEKGNFSGDQVEPWPSTPVIDPAAVGAAISFRGLRKDFGGKTVLDGLDLDVPAGQFLAIIGKSGCGKSTLLRLLAGLDRATAGAISHDADATGHADIRIMFQEPRLLPWERVMENVAVGLTGIVTGEVAKARARDILSEVGLADRARVALGPFWRSETAGGAGPSTGVGQPRILALDEPLGALDALTRIEMQGLLERVWQKQRFTSVLVTHDVAEAVVLADRVVVLDEGRIALDLHIPLARPRRRGGPEIARLEQRILDQLFGEAWQGAGIPGSARVAH